MSDIKSKVLYQHDFLKFPIINQANFIEDFREWTIKKTKPCCKLATLLFKLFCITFYKANSNFREVTLLFLFAGTSWHLKIMHCVVSISKHTHTHTKYCAPLPFFLCRNQQTNQSQSSFSYKLKQRKCEKNMRSAVNCNAKL